jgi:hypothetical protein
MNAPDEANTEVQPADQHGLDGFDFDFDETAVPPPRRRRLPAVTALLLLSAAVGIGVVFGVLIQKHWGGSPAASGFNGRAPAAARGGSGAGPSGARSFAQSGTAGQVKAIDGTTLYVTDTQGNLVKVTTGPGVTVRVTRLGTLKSISPGDFVVVQGTKTTSGYRATSISDSGTSGGGAGGPLVFGQPGGSANGGGGGTQSLPGLP